MLFKRLHLFILSKINHRLLTGYLQFTLEISLYIYPVILLFYNNTHHRHTKCINTVHKVHRHTLHYITLQYTTMVTLQPSPIQISIKYHFNEYHYIPMEQYEHDLLFNQLKQFNKVTRCFTMKEEKQLVNYYIYLWRSQFNKIKNTYTEVMQVNKDTSRLLSLNILLGEHNFDRLEKYSTCKEFTNEYLITIVLDIYIKENLYNNNNNNNNNNVNENNITTYSPVNTSSLNTTSTNQIHHQTKLIEKSFYYGYYINVYHKSKMFINLRRLNIDQLKYVNTKLLLYFSLEKNLMKDNQSHHHRQHHHRNTNVNNQFHYYYYKNKSYTFRVTTNIDIEDQLEYKEQSKQQLPQQEDEDMGLVNNTVKKTGLKPTTTSTTQIDTSTSSPILIYKFTCEFELFSVNENSYLDRLDQDFIYEIKVYFLNQLYTITDTNNSNNDLIDHVTNMNKIITISKVKPYTTTERNDIIDNRKNIIELNNNSITSYNNDTSMDSLNFYSKIKYNPPTTVSRIKNKPINSNPIHRVIHIDIEDIESDSDTDIEEKEDQQ